MCKGFGDVSGATLPVGLRSSKMTCGCTDEAHLQYSGPHYIWEQIVSGSRPYNLLLACQLVGSSVKSHTNGVKSIAWYIYELNNTCVQTQCSGHYHNRNVQLWQQDKEEWTREEALANIVVAEFVELPEMYVIQVHGSEDESFVSRVVRQVLDAQVRFVLWEIFRS